MNKPCDVTHVTFGDIPRHSAHDSKWSGCHLRPELVESRRFVAFTNVTTLHFCARRKCNIGSEFM